MESPVSSESAPGIAEGDLVAGKYRVERVLGEGGMGVVVAARHEELGQRVAIKILRHEISRMDGALERFLREARAAARIESDHVARVFDVGKLGSDSAFMVMEHLEGADLEKLLERRGRLDVAETVDYVLEALEAVAHAHASGMVHRDLKPSNLFLAEKSDGTRRIKVLDFGISKAEDGFASTKSSTLTSPQALLGSPAYMAPEQIRSSKSVDQRADIWSLGVILYELLSGVSPFAGETVGETFALVIDAAPTPLRERRPEVPEVLAAAVARCLDPDRDTRFVNVADLAAAIAPYGSARAPELCTRIARVLGVENRGERHSIVPVRQAGDVNAAAATMAADGGEVVRGGAETISAWSGQETGARKPRRALAAVSLALLVVLGLGTVIFMRSRADAPVQASDSPVPPRVASPTPGGASTPNTPEVLPVATVVPPPASAAPSKTPAKAPKGTSIATPTTPAKVPTKPAFPQSLLDGRD